MNILAIGNSFSQDATRYLHGIAKADGEDLNVVNLYIGGCSLEKHYNNMLSDEKTYELQYNGIRTEFLVSLSKALLNRSWDIVTIQQASHLSFDYESYEPYATELAAYVRRHSPGARLYIHQTWAYEDGSNRLSAVAKYDSFASMQMDVISAYNKAAKSINADGIIPSGELFLTLLNSGITRIHRDTFHASLGIGRYALGLLWYQTLMGKSVLENTFSDFDEDISDGDVKRIKEAVSLLFKS